MAKKIDIRDYYNWKNKEWYEADVDMKSAYEAFDQNIQALKNAQNWREREDRPITVCVLHGSGRHPERSCAHELSSSAMLLERGLELATEELRKEGEEAPVVWKYNLRELTLEACNACVSSTSALCHFPCSCFPADDITSKIYPAVMAADVLLISTPVNQAGTSSRIKLVIDRLISLDGGYSLDKLVVKDDAYKQVAVATSLETPVYDKRMFGKVAAYFVTSKDIDNRHEEAAPVPREFRKLDYIDTTIGQLAIQGAEYGWFHADLFYAVHSMDPDVEYAYDKDHLDKAKTDHQNAKSVAMEAIKLARKFRTEPPEYGGRAGRINRT